MRSVTCVCSPGSSSTGYPVGPGVRAYNTLLLIVVNISCLVFLYWLFGAIDFGKCCLILIMRGIFVVIK